MSSGKFRQNVNEIVGDKTMKKTILDLKAYKQNQHPSILKYRRKYNTGDKKISQPNIVIFDGIQVMRYGSHDMQSHFAQTQIMPSLDEISNIA